MLDCKCVAKLRIIKIQPSVGQGLGYSALRAKGEIWKHETQLAASMGVERATAWESYFECSSL